MKKVLIFLVLVSTFVFSLGTLETHAMEETNLPINLVTNPYAYIDSPADETYATGGIMYRSNYIPFTSNLVVYFPTQVEGSSLRYDFNPYVYSSVLILDANYNMLSYSKFSSNPDYTEGIFGQWFSIEFGAYPTAVYMQIEIYGHGISYEESMSNRQALDGLYVAKASIFMESYLANITMPADYYYNEGLEDGYLKGQNDMFENGSALYGYDFDSSYDFLLGEDLGRNQNVGAGVTTFMEDFDKWIVSAILIVMVLGGFLAVRRKSSGE